MDEINMFSTADGMGVHLHGPAGFMVDSNLDEEAADRLSVVTGRQLGCISRSLAQDNE